jgi:hypothetical protein
MPADHLVFSGVELGEDTNAAGGLGDGELVARDVGAGFTTTAQVLAQ